MIEKYTVIFELLKPFFAKRTDFLCLQAIKIGWKRKKGSKRKSNFLPFTLEKIFKSSEQRVFF